MTEENIFISKIEGAFRGLRLNTKTIENCNAQKWINKLKKVNDGLAEDYEVKFDQQKRMYSRKHNNQFVTTKRY